MPDRPLLDLQDAMEGSVTALRGLRDLLQEADAPGKDAFVVVTPEGLAVLVDMAFERLERADGLLRDYVAQARRLYG